MTESNVRMVNYLDVILTLQDGSLIPYHKPDEMIQYISKECNDPPSVIKQLLAFIEKRLSNHSSDVKKYSKNLEFIKKIH